MAEGMAEDTGSTLHIDTMQQKLVVNSPGAGPTIVANFVPSVVGHTCDQEGNHYGYVFKFENSIKDLR